MLLSPTNLGSAASTHTSKAQHKRAHGRGAAVVLHDKSEHKNSYERHMGGRGNTNVDVHGEQNQPWQTGGGPSICSRSPSRQVRISLPTKVKPGRHEYRMMSPVESFTPTIASANTHTRKQKATLASAFQAQGPENIINTLSNEDWHPAGWSGSSRHKALTCTLGLAQQRSVRTCACTVQSEVATGKMSSTSTDSFVDG